MKTNAIVNDNTRVNSCVSCTHTVNLLLPRPAYSRPPWQSPGSYKYKQPGGNFWRADRSADADGVRSLCVIGFQVRGTKGVMFPLDLIIVFFCQGCYFFLIKRRTNRIEIYHLMFFVDSSQGQG